MITEVNRFLDATTGLPRRDRAVWGLFSDWCAAWDRVPLPADPETLALFLGDNPAAAATQRRRIAVIGAVHRAGGAVSPGRAEAVRQLIDARRAQRLRERTRDVAAAVAALPTVGWPTLLFARRDAAILVLATTGITFAAMSALRVADVEVGERDVTLHVAGILLKTPTELLELGIDPVHIMGSWIAVRGVQHHAPSTRALAAHLRGEPLRRGGAPTPDLPLLTPLDRWGAEPLRPTPLDRRAIAAVITGHLTGAAPTHRAVDRGGEASRTPEPAPVAAPGAPQLLDPGSFARGIAARRRAEESLSDVGDVLDEVSDRADRLMKDLIDLIEGS